MEGPWITPAILRDQDQFIAAAGSAKSVLSTSTLQTNIQAKGENNQPPSHGKRNRSTSSATMELRSDGKRRRSMSSESFEVIEPEHSRTSQTGVGKENASPVEPKDHQTSPAVVENEILNSVNLNNAGTAQTPKPKNGKAEGDKSLTEEEYMGKREKGVLYLRHRLQKGLLNGAQTPKEAEMAAMSGYLGQLEHYTDLEGEIIKKTKIHKVLKAIIKLNSIPKEEEFKFKQRSADLLNGWSSALSFDAEAPLQAPSGEQREMKTKPSPDDETLVLDGQSEDRHTAGDAEVEPSRNGKNLLLEGQNEDEPTASDETPMQAAAEEDDMETEVSPNGENMGLDGQSEDQPTSNNHTTHRKPPPTDVLPLDPAGDRQLTIRWLMEDVPVLASFRVLVSSACLRRISPFWKSLLDSAVTEPVVEGYPWDTVLMLLNVAHANLHDVPEWIDHNDLRAITSLCVNTGAIDLMRPFLRNWILPSMQAVADPDDGEWLFISWVLGYQDTFEAVTQSMALTVGSDDDIYYRDLDERLKVAENEVYLIILNNVSRVRSSIINELINVCHTFVERLSKQEACNESPPSGECQSMALGSLIRGLNSMDTKLWPQRPDPKNLAISVHDLILELADVEILNGHENCDINTDFHEALALSLSTHAPSGYKTLEDKHLKHFRSFRLRISECDPIVWKSKAIATMGFVEKDAAGVVCRVEKGLLIAHFPNERSGYYSEGDDSNWSDQYSDSDYDSPSEPDEEFLEPDC